MPSTRRQKAKARRSTEKDLLSDFDIMDVVSGDENHNLIEWELVNTINGSVSHLDTEAFSKIRRKSSQDNEIRDFNVKNEYPTHDKLIKSL